MITCFGSCRVNKINNSNNIGNLINYTHTTKEALQMIKFLQNKINIPFPYNIYCFRTGIINKKEIKNNTNFQNLFNKSNIVIIEICSNKVYINNNYYLHHLSIDNRYGRYKNTPLKFRNNSNIYIQDYNEIYNDLKLIKEILKFKKIIIISHYNAKLNNNFLFRRNKLILMLKNICQKLNIYFINPRKDIFKNYKQNIIINKDLGHYTNLGISIFNNYITNYIKNI